MKTINNTLIPKEWFTFKRNLIPPPECENCNNNCTILYDHHHDEYFSLNCGLVILEQGNYLIPYNINTTLNKNTTNKKLIKEMTKYDNNNSIKRQKK